MTEESKTDELAEFIASFEEAKSAGRESWDIEKANILFHSDKVAKEYESPDEFVFLSGFLCGAIWKEGTIKKELRQQWDRLKLEVELSMAKMS